MEFSSITTYRLAFFLNSLSLIIKALIGPITILFIYTVSPGFNGWTLPELLVFLGTLEVTFGLVHLLVLGISWKTACLVIDGTFDSILTKPVNPLAYVFSQSLDYDGAIQIITGLVIVFIGLSGAGFVPSLLNWVFYALLIIDGFFLWLTFNLVIGSLCFKYTRIDAWFNVVFSLSLFGDYPIDIYGNLMSFIFTFVLPVGLVSFYPSSYLLGRLSDPVLFGVVTLIVGLMTLASIKFYGYSLRHYTSANG
jgi:ABC-2 type transport system permease protein